MKVDGGIPSQLAVIPEAVSLLERWGYRGGWTGELLETFAVVAPIEELAAKILDRYDGLVDRVMFSLPVGMSDTAAEAVLAALQP